MFRKYIILALIIGLLNLSFAATSFANTNEDKKAATAEKVKAGILKLGVGPDAKVEVKLYDNSKIKGYVSEATNDHFVVVDAKTAVATEIPYPNVKQVKGNNLSGGIKIAIGVGIAIGLILILAVAVGRGG